MCHTGRELDIGDDRVALVVRVDLPKGAASQLLVLADTAERHSAECWPFDARDNEPNDFRLRAPRPIQRPPEPDYCSNGVRATKPLATD